MSFKVGQIIQNANGTYAKVHPVGGMDRGFALAAPTQKMEEILNIAETFGKKVNNKINTKA